MKLRLLPRDTEDLIRNEEAHPDSLSLVTSLRYDPSLRDITRHIPIALECSHNNKFFLSNLHYQRIKYGARLLGWDVSQLSYESFCNKLDEIEQQIIAVETNTDAPRETSPAHAGSNEAEQPYRIRLVFDKNGQLEGQFNPAAKRTNMFSGLMNLPPIYEIFVDHIQMEENYSRTAKHLLKTSIRTVYDEARKRHNINLGDMKEVLLVSHDDHLIEGSLTGVAVEINDQWVTPPISRGGMCSTVRSFLIELGYLKEGEIHMSNFRADAPVLLFNGVMGVVQGKITQSN